MNATACKARPYLLDVSRLVWRGWGMRQPTGIDRVCRAYLSCFATRANAVLQWRGHRLVLPPRDSEVLADMLLDEGAGLDRARFSLLVARAIARAPPKPGELAGRILLNVGHTGLDSRSLPRWIAAQALRAVFLIHDLIPITHPHLCREGEEQRHRVRLRQALQSARGLVLNSAATRDDLTRFARAERLAMPRHRIAHLGIAPPAPRTIRSGERAPNFPGPDFPKPYFIAVGTIEGRKNHALLLDCWERLHARLGPATPRLVIAGQRGWQADAVFERLDREAARGGPVTELNACDDAQLSALVAGARALLMPSRAEGYGLPVAEALAAGTAVIAADLPVYREIAGDIPCLLDPADAPAWDAALADHLDEGPDAQRQRAALPAYGAPCWNAHFSALENWLADLAPN